MDTTLQDRHENAVDQRAQVRQRLDSHDTAISSLQTQTAANAIAIHDLVDSEKETRGDIRDIHRWMLEDRNGK